MSSKTSVVLPSRPGWITLAQNLCGRDRLGREHRITLLEIRAEAYIPDVYVRLDRDAGDAALYDDETFVAFVNDALRALGYEGPAFDRAELGLQGASFIVLEPGEAFRRFVAERYGWRDLDACAGDLSPATAPAPT